MTRETVEQFLARGGQIETVQQGETGLTGAGLFTHMTSGASATNAGYLSSMAKSRAKAVAAAKRKNQKAPVRRLRGDA